MGHWTGILKEPSLVDEESRDPERRLRKGGEFSRPVPVVQLSAKSAAATLVFGSDQNFREQVPEFQGIQAPCAGLQGQKCTETNKQKKKEG